MLEETFSAAINRAMALDPELPEKLGKFAGKVISLHFIGPEKTVYLLVDQNRINALMQYDDQPDVTISGSPVAMVKMMLKPNVASLLLKGEVEIKGDTRLGNAFKKLLREMEINWQQPLAEIIGDSATQGIETGLLQFNQWCKKSTNAFGLDVSEYLQEERRDVVSEAELEQFNRQVDELRNVTDRLEMKLKKITQDNPA